MYVYIEHLELFAILSFTTIQPPSEDHKDSQKSGLRSSSAKIMKFVPPSGALILTSMFLPNVIAGPLSTRFTIPYQCFDDDIDFPAPNPEDCLGAIDEFKNEPGFSTTKVWGDGWPFAKLPWYWTNKSCLIRLINLNGGYFDYFSLESTNPAVYDLMNKSVSGAETGSWLRRISSHWS